MPTAETINRPSRKWLGRFAVRGIVMAVTAACSACADRGPVALSSQFTLDGRHLGRGAKGNVNGTLCRVRLATIDDVRTDTQSMGSISGRAVRATDTAAWLRSGLASLKRDSRLLIVENPSDPSDLTLSAHLLKAYIVDQNLAKAATVVVRVQYDRVGKQEVEQIYRGSDDGVNWIGGNDETQSAFDGSLSEILKQVDADVIEYCAK